MFLIINYSCHSENLKNHVCFIHSTIYSFIEQGSRCIYIWIIWIKNILLIYCVYSPKVHCINNYYNVYKIHECSIDFIGQPYIKGYKTILIWVSHALQIGEYFHQCCFADWAILLTLQNEKRKSREIWENNVSAVSRFLPQTYIWNKMQSFPWIIIKS